MSDFSPGEAGGVFAGLVAALAVLGKGLAWLLNWNETRAQGREARLKAWEESLAEREKKHHEEVEHRLATTDQRLQLVTAVLFEMVGEMQLLDPGSAVVAKARVILQQAYPLDFETPADLQTLVRRIDNKEQPK